jgi:5-methylcytosine-specific restriction protein A
LVISNIYKRRFMPTRPQTHSLASAQNAKRPSSAERGYDYAWQKFRAWYATQVPAICVRCGDALASKLMHLDHIIPLEQGGTKFEKANLQWLCEECHNRKTAAEDNGFGRLS